MCAGEGIGMGRRGIVSQRRAGLAEIFETESNNSEVYNGILPYNEWVGQIHDKEGYFYGCE